MCEYEISREDFVEEDLEETQLPVEDTINDVERKLEELFESEDMVNHPPHYNTRSMEVIDIIEVCLENERNPKVAYNMSNVLKYLLRFREKNGMEDLKKCVWYLNRVIDKVLDE